MLLLRCLPVQLAVIRAAVEEISAHHTFTAGKVHAAMNASHHVFVPRHLVVAVTPDFSQVRRHDEPDDDDDENEDEVFQSR